MKKIKFGIENLNIQEIVPAKKALPHWYKTTLPYSTGKFSLIDGTATFKTCSPFMDSLTSGYIATLWQAVEVRPARGDSSLKDLAWPIAEYPVAKLRDSSTNALLPVPAGHTPQHFAWNTPFSIKTPKGYSALITHPFNRFDLPFTTLSGIVDTDGVLGPGSLPFFIREDFEGIIPAGTPIFQVMPFKRDAWTHSIDEEVKKEGDAAREKGMAFAPGFYKKNKWVKKQFD